MSPVAKKALASKGEAAVTGRESRIVIVLGMHRSGTSAMAASLAELGLEMGNSLLPSAKDNPAGFFEDERVVQINQRLLISLGSGWDDYENLPAGWEESAPALEARKELAVVLEDLAASGRLVAVKDPRVCRLLPLWKRVIADLRLRPAFIVTVRHPMEVAMSLNRRDGLSEFRSRMLWLAYTLAAEANSRGEARGFVDYNELIRDPGKAIFHAFKAMGEGFDDLAIAAKARGIGSVDASLRNERHTEGSLDPLLNAAYQALCGAAKLGFTDEPAFDRILRNFNAERDLASRSREDERRTQQKGLGLLQVATLREIASLQSAFELGVKLPRPLQPRLYLRSPGGVYSEAEASDGIALDDFERRFRFKPHVSPDRQIGFLRIDPDITSGYFSISDVKLGKRRLQGLARRVGAVSERRLGAPKGTVVVCASGVDPWIELDIGDLGLTAGECGDIEVSVAAHSVSSMLLEAYDRLVSIHESDEAVRRAVAEGVASIRSELAGVHAANASALNGMADSLSELERRDGELRASVELLSEKIEASWRETKVALHETAASILPLQKAVREVHAVATAANVTLDALHRRAANDRAHYEEQLAAFAAASAELRSAFDHQLAGLTEAVRAGSADARAHADDLAAASAKSLVEMRETVEVLRRASEKDREVAAMVHIWMQRRSLSYWWRRVFR